MTVQVEAIVVGECECCGVGGDARKLCVVLQWCLSVRLVGMRQVLTSGCWCRYVQNQSYLGRQSDHQVISHQI